MLTIRTCKAFTKALGEYLRQADYYSQGMKVEGRCYGQLCVAVGLCEGAEITDEAFERVAGNRHAFTGEKLTERMAAGRRAGYDAVFNAPKSISIQAFIGGDERLVAAHEMAVNEALRELESFARHQDGRGINKRYLPSGGVAAAIFRHGESRALDPHLHSHAFIFNVTQDRRNGRLLALESSDIFERTKYLTEVYRNALAAEVQRLGYAIERREHGFELAGVSPSLLERFSKRAQERNRTIAVREAELGRELSRDEIAVLIRESRADKQYELTPDQVRERQLGQVDQRELAELVALRTAERYPVHAADLTAAVDRASEHLFERRTVVTDHEFFSEVIRQDYGAHPLAEVKAAVFSTDRLLKTDGQISTREALDLESDLVAKLNAGVGRFDGGFGHLSSTEGAHLSLQQRHAVNAVLASCDQVTVLRGRAGTGKTQTLSTIIEQINPYGRDVVCVAPSTQAVDVLRQDGATQNALGHRIAGQALAAAETVQRLLVDSALQKAVEHQVIIVDEYGLLSTRQLKQLVDLAEARRARLVLVGDSAQHKSVEAGDGARIIERESRVRVVTLSEVHRQAANPAYKKAAEDLAAGRFSSALKRLDRMGAIVEIESPGERRARMVQEWLRARETTKLVRTRAGVEQRPMTAIMIAPTWAEIDQLNERARCELKRSRRIGDRDEEFRSLRAKDWTRSQLKDVRNYQPGDVLVAHKATKQFGRGEELRVVRKDNGRLIVRHADRESSVSPRQSGLAWTVCVERSTRISSGEQIRLRAIGHAVVPDGTTRKLANGAQLKVQRIDDTGRLVLADGSTLRTRQFEYAYAITSHASQGITVDKVLLAGAASREGLYVSATRGRESLRIFVRDRQEFLAGAGLRSEARISAIEFARNVTLHSGLKRMLARAQAYFARVQSQVVEYLKIHPDMRLVPPPEVHVLPVPPVERPHRVRSADASAHQPRQRLAESHQHLRPRL